MDQIRDKILGCIYGLAIGDALGYPVEFMQVRNIRTALGPKGVTGFDSLDRLGRGTAHPIGFYSDDTQMTLATAQGLLDSRSDDLIDVMSHISRRYVEWSESKDNDRAPGNSCMQGTSNMRSGMHWSISGVKGAEGCGTVMRTAPIGIAFYNDTKTILQIAEAASACTHAGLSTIAAGVLNPYAVSLALQNRSAKEISDSTINLAGNLNSDLWKKMLLARHNLTIQNTDTAIKQIGEGWKGDEAMALALYCFMKYPNDYRKTVLLGANTDGDSDSIASIAGGISGAYNGFSKIPREWVERIENKDLLGQIANQLADKYQ